ncbi:MAG: glycosyltransferase family 39 protein [Chlorobi bacterium]|nr:glycosyltransferase family 39 protein [Chlorobiota bacterium]
MQKIAGKQHLIRMNKISGINRNTLIIYGLGLTNILFHLVFYNKLEYHRDELLYFSLGLHPAFGYATVPPLIGWIASFMQMISGYSLFAVKLFPALLSGAFVIISTFITKELGGKSYAQILTAIAVMVMPVSMRAFNLFQPVSTDLFFWTLITYYVLRYVNTQKEKYLIITGAVSGLAMLNKYLVALYLLALFSTILFTGHRIIFKKRSFYIGLFAGLIIFLPNMIWQINHGFPVISHMQELHDQQLVHVNRLDFLSDQIMMPFASVLLIFPGFFCLLKNRKYRFMAYSVLFVVITLLILRGKSYYTIGILPVLTASGAVAAEKYISNKLVRYAIPVFLILITLPVVPFGIPVYGEEKLVCYFQNLEDKYGIVAGRRFEDGTIHSLPQDYADQLGWEELVKITSDAYRLIPDKSKGLIYCENYGQASAVFIIGKKYNLPEPVSFSDNYFYRKPAEFNPDIEYFIYINDELGEDVKELFQDIKIIGRVSDINAREYGTAVYLCTNPKRSFNTFWKSVLLRLNDR